MSTVLSRTGGRVTERAATAGNGVRRLLLAVGLVLALALPWFIYPPVAMDIACWALFAVALDLLLGYTGLLSFGHAAFWGSSAYVTGLVAVHAGAPFPVAVLGGALVAMALAVPIGYLSVRRTGIYFAMVTLAFAQMIYFLANQWRSVTGGENGLQGIPRELFGLDLSEPFFFYYAGLPLILAGLAFAWRIVRSPFGKVLVAIRDNPARARALGYPVDRHKLLVRDLRRAVGARRWRVRDQPRLRLPAGGLLDHLRQGGDHDRAGGHRDAVGQCAGGGRSSCSSRTTSPAPASTASASSPARSSSWS